MTQTRTRFRAPRWRGPKSTRVGAGATADAKLRTVVAGVVLLSGLAAVAGVTVPALAGAATSQDWPMYLHDAAHSAATTDANLNLTNAPLLQPGWTYQTGGVISSGVTVVGTTAYVGSWDGYEYAINTTNGALIWKTYLGVTNDPACSPPSLGVSSTATVVNGVLYVGGGNSYWYALDPTTGTILWDVYTGDNSPTSGHYNWSSPLIVNGYAYIGVSDVGDCPLVQGQLLQVSLTTHLVVNTYNVVPTGQVGGTVWASPAYDSATNTVFIATGNLNDYTQTQSQAIIAVDGNTLQPKSWWQLPFAASVTDSDWSTSPVLTTDAGGDQLLSVANKNGVLYTFNRNNLSAGPVWEQQIAIGGDCLTCGQGSVSTGTFANGVLYWAGANTEVNGHGSGGSITAFDPGTGTVLWKRQTDQPILTPLAYVNGMVAEAEGSTFEVLNAATGALLYSYVLPAPGVYTPISVAQSQFFLGGLDGKVYTFGIGPSPATPPADPNCPSGFTCQDIHNPPKGSEQTVNGTLTVTAGGSGIKGTGDQFRLVSAPVTGDAQESTEIVSQSPQPGQKQQAGLIVRQSAASGSPFYAVLSYPNDSPPDAQVWYRSSFSKNPVLLAKVPFSAPMWMIIQRKGNLFSAGLSSDGTNFRLVPGSTADVDLPTTTLQGVAVGSGSSTTKGTASFASLTVATPLSTTMAPVPPSDPCPSPWTCTDLGNPTPIGDATAAGSTLSLSGSGSGFGTTTDSAHYVYQSVTGNTAVSAQVVTATGAPAKAQDGVMMRAGTAPTAPMYSVYVNPGGSVTVQWRFLDGIKYSHNIKVTTVTSPAYLEIVRYQDTRYSWPNTFFSALTSADGVNWTPVLGSSVAIDMGTGSYLAGVVATAGASGVTTSATFNAATISTVTTPPPSACPSGWMCADIGTGVPAGNQLTQNGTLTVQASGDIWSVYDEFRFVYQNFSGAPTTGDGTVVAHVDSQSGGGPWMRSGVMLRAGTDPQAPYYAAFVTPANGVAVQWRSAQAGLTNQVTQAAVAAPAWVMIDRYTDTVHDVVYYSAYSSTDGVHFTYVPNSQVALTLPGTLIAGFATEANSSSNLSVATVDSLAAQAVEQPPPYMCPSAWSCADIGGALPPGTDQLNSSGTWNEIGGGGDIWGTSDSFHFVAQPLTADGTVTSHVTAQQNTSAWAKAGPMLRATADPGSPYYGAFVTPGNGIAVQWRGTQGGGSNQILTAGTVPTYLKVARYTTTGTAPQTLFTAYTSPDGVNWTAIAGSTVALTMTGPLLGGFAITSHTQGVGSAVTLDIVAVNAQELPPPGFACPSGWSCGEIGAATPLGNQTLTGGTWSIQGGGGDIWGTADAFHFVWQPLAADGSITARAVSQTASSPWAKGGLMMRATVDPGSPYYALFVTPSNGIVVQWRGTQAASSAQVATTGAAPSYLKVSRSGTTFSASTSPDGVTWTPVPGSTLSVGGLSGTLLRGLAVTSHNTAQTSTVVYDTVSTAP